MCMMCGHAWKRAQAQADGSLGRVIKLKILNILVPFLAHTFREPTDSQSHFYSVILTLSHGHSFPSSHLTFGHTEINSTFPSSLPISSIQVKRWVERLNWKKAVAPDGVSLKILKACAEQQCGIQQHLFSFKPINRSQIDRLKETLHISLQSAHFILPLKPRILSSAEMLRLCTYGVYQQLKAECRELVNLFAAWSGNNYLILNVKKTKETIVDFCTSRNKTTLFPFWEKKKNATLRRSLNRDKDKADWIATYECNLK